MLPPPEVTIDLTSIVVDELSGDNHCRTSLHLQSPPPPPPPPPPMHLYDGASIIVASILMTVDTKCMIFIPSLNERECIPFTETPSQTPTSDPTPDTSPEPNSDPSESSASDNTAAIIGGVVAVILIIAITVIVIAIVLKSRRHGDVSIKNAPEK